MLAETGSGKSLTFILPLMNTYTKGDGLKAIIIAPTRELAIQLYKEFLMFTSKNSARVKFLRKGTTPKDEKSFDEFCQGCEVLISTPLKASRLAEVHKFKGIERLIVDEADKIFDMGFIEQINSIIDQFENKDDVLKYMFSATMQPLNEEVLHELMTKKPIKIQIGIKNATASTVKQKLIYCGSEDGKLVTLRQMIKDGFEPPMLLFVQSKDRAK